MGRGDGLDPLGLPDAREHDADPEGFGRGTPGEIAVRDPLPRSVFLTGGSGLVGSHVAEQLRAAGTRVVALQRKGSSTGFLRSIGCEISEGDVRASSERLAELMAGAECLIHSAALVYSGAPWSEIHAVNVEATRAVMAAAALAGVSHAVHVSSIAVYGTGLRLADEDTPLDAPLSPPNLYARSKREAEQVAGEVAVEAGMTLTIVRPAAVYGERDRLFAPRLSRVVKLPWIPILGSGGNRVPVVYAGNVARGILLSLGHPGPDRVFNLSEDDPVTQKELLAAFAQGFGRSPRFVSVPAGLIRGAAKVTSRLGASVPGMRGLPLERVAQYGLEHNPYPSRRAHDVLGWTEHVGHREALRRTAEWLSGCDRN